MAVDDSEARVEDLWFLEDRPKDELIRDRVGPNGGSLPEGEHVVDQLWQESVSNVEILHRLNDPAVNSVYAIAHCYRGGEVSLFEAGSSRRSEVGEKENVKVEDVLVYVDIIRERIEAILLEGMESEIAKIRWLDLGRDFALSLAMLRRDNPDADDDPVRTFPEFFSNFIRNGVKDCIRKVREAGNYKEFTSGLRFALNVFAGRYVGPENITESVHEFMKLYPGWNGTFALEVENEDDPEVAAQNLKRILGLIDEIADFWKDTADKSKLPGERPMVSVKISGWAGKHFSTGDEARCIARLGLLEIVNKAKERGVFVMIDEEESETRDYTEDLYKEVLADSKLSEHVGVVQQTYLVDSLKKTMEFVEVAKSNGTKIEKLRMVKGAYHGLEQEKEGSECTGPDSIVYDGQEKTDRNFLRNVEYLFQNEEHWNKLAVATMNYKTLAAVVELVIRYNVDPDRLESQQLKGMVDPLGWAVAENGLMESVKYVPGGTEDETIMYSNRRLDESPEQFKMLKEVLGGPLGLLRKVFTAKIKRLLDRII